MVEDKRFETSRLLLRTLSEDDAEALHIFWSDVRVTRYMHINSLETMEQARAFIANLNTLMEQNELTRYSIVLKETNEVIGTCGFDSFVPEHQTAEISYDLGKPYWGQGFASEALRMILSDGFEGKELNRIEARIEPDNIRSIHALHKLGFMQEGKLRQAARKGDRFTDMLIFSLLKEEFE